MINFKCEKCGYFYTLNEKHAGNKILCGRCGHVNHAPAVQPPYMTKSSPDTQYIDETMPDFNGFFTALLEYERSAPTLEPAGR